MSERRPNRVRGPSHDRFWSYCTADELRLQRCETCQHLSWPPVEACERCGRDELTWERLSGRGRVASWCTFERRYYAELDVPWDTILVELDEGPLFISNPSGFGNDDMRQGMQVRVTFLDCEDDAGLFRLPVFEKA
jgi:uncharacterized OB-fold protein